MSYVGVFAHLQSLRLWQLCRCTTTNTLMELANISSKETYSCPVYKTPDRRGITTVTPSLSRAVSRVSGASENDQDKQQLERRGFTLLPLPEEIS